MRVYFVRHGESKSNAGESLHDMDGDGDSLSDLGWKQSEQLGKRLAGRKFSRIYVSSMRRAQETAAAIADHVDAPITFFPEIHEVVRGDTELALKTREERSAYWRSYFIRMADIPPDAPVGDGESFAEIAARARLILTALRKNESDSSSVLVVTHGGLLRFLLGICILGDDFGPQHARTFMRVGNINTGISEFILTPDDFRLVTWMDQAHL